MFSLVIYLNESLLNLNFKKRDSCSFQIMFNESSIMLGCGTYVDLNIIFGHKTKTFGAFSL